METEVEVGHVAERFALNGKMVAFIVFMFFNEIVAHRGKPFIKLMLFVFGSVPNAVNQPFLRAFYPIDGDFVEKVVVEDYLSDARL